MQGQYNKAEMSELFKISGMRARYVCMQDAWDKMRRFLERSEHVSKMQCNSLQLQYLYKFQLFAADIFLQRF